MRRLQPSDSSTVKAVNSFALMLNIAPCRIIPNISSSGRRDERHHGRWVPALVEMRCEPKPLVPSVRRHAPDHNTQYRQKPHNDIKRRLRVTFKKSWQIKSIRAVAEASLQ